MLLQTGKSFVGLRYAAWANSMRHRLVADLRTLVRHITLGTGGQTHYNRINRFRGRTNICGIITKRLTRQKQFFGFQTGDIVKAVVPNGKKEGIHLGRVAVRKSGYFNIQKRDGVVQGIGDKHCRVVQRNDGYGYTIKQRS